MLKIEGQPDSLALRVDLQAWELMGDPVANLTPDEARALAKNNVITEAVMRRWGSDVECGNMPDSFVEAWDRLVRSEVYQNATKKWLRGAANN